MTKNKEELKLLGDHLKSNPRRHFGQAPGHKVECAKHKQFHDFYEGCPWCPSWSELCDESVERMKLDMQPERVADPDDDTDPHGGYWP